jgi:hypothetical protein
VATRADLELRKRLANRVRGTEHAERFFQWLAEEWTDPNTGKLIRFKCGVCSNKIEEFPFGGNPEHRNYDLRCPIRSCSNHVRWTETTMKHKLNEARQTGTHITVQ